MRYRKATTHSSSSSDKTLRSGHEKRVVGTKLYFQFGNYANYGNVFTCFICSISPHDVKIPKKSRAYRPKMQFFGTLSLISRSPHRRSRPYMERIRQGEGGWSRPSKTALEQSHLTEKFEVRESHTETETKKNPGQSLSSQEHESFYV